MIDMLAEILIIGTVLVALIKRTEMALWLLLITFIGAMIELSNTGNESATVFFCGANLALMFAGFDTWRITKTRLPLMIGMLASINVILNFSNYLMLVNTGGLSFGIGIATGVIGYLQLVLVVFMGDSKGLMNDIINGPGDFIHSLQRMASNNRHNGRHK